jgi:hypothetical protein
MKCLSNKQVLLQPLSGVIVITIRTQNNANSRSTLYTPSLIKSDAYGLYRASLIHATFLGGHECRISKLKNK